WKDKMYVGKGEKGVESKPGDVLAVDVPGNIAADRGGYVNLDGDGSWWIPSGRIFYSTDADIVDPAITASKESAEAHRHFFLPRKFADPFNQTAKVDYVHDLLVSNTEDPLGNTVTADHDYHVLAPRLMTDPNGTQTEVTFDVLGMVSGTAVMGKAGPQREGDSLNGFQVDLTDTEVERFYNVDHPHVPAPGILRGATTRIVYDLHRFKRTRDANPKDT